MPTVATAAASGGSSTASLLILALPILLIAFMFFSQRRRQKATQQMQSELQPGDRVMTAGGLYGTLRWLDDSKVQLEVAPGVLVEWDRRAIMRAPETATPGPAGPASTPAPPAQPTSYPDGAASGEGTAYPDSTGQGEDPTASGDDTDRR